MSGARGVAEVYQAQWSAHLNSTLANAFRQTLAEEPPDPVARIGRLLTATVDGPAPQSVPPSASPSDPMSQPQSDAAYNSRWYAHINAKATQAWKQTFAARPADPAVHLGRLLLAASTAGAVTALEAENASLRAQLERERGAMRTVDQSLASSATSEKMAAAAPAALPAGSTAALQAEIVGLRAQVKELTLENEQLKHGPSGHAVPGEESGALQLKASLERTGATDWSDKRVGHLLGVLDVNGDGSVDRSEFETTCLQLSDVLAALAGPVEEAAASPALQALRDQTQAVLGELEAAKPSTTAAGTASLPAGLKDFTPLAKEPEIAAIAAGLHELELAVARNPTSEPALAALRAETEKLALATQAKIDARTAAARGMPAAEELEATWTKLMLRVVETKTEHMASWMGPDMSAKDAQEIAQKVQWTVDRLQAAWEKASVATTSRGCCWRQTKTK